MGLEIFIIFALKCSDVLAWAVLGFLYPLYASIQVINAETLSPQILKLLAYWICFSAVTLVERVFGHQLLRCLPIWPFVRLFGLYWFVRHDLNGAYYVYKNYFHRFLKSEKDVCRPTSFPEPLPDIKVGQSTEGVPDNVDDECQNIIEEPNAVDKDIDTIDDQVEEGNFAAEANRNDIIEPHHSRAEERRGEDYLAITELLNEIKKDASLMLQIGRSMQEVNYSAIMESLDQMKNDASVILQMGRSMQDVYLLSHGIELREGSFYCRLCGDRCVGSMSIKSHLVEVEHTSMIKLLKEDGVEMRGSGFWCTICYVMCINSASLKSHISGRKHIKKSTMMTN